MMASQNTLSSFVHQPESNSNHGKTTTDSYYPTELSIALNDLRDEDQLCDIVVNVGGRAFNAHKVVLAASSSYFKAMFTSGFKESTEKEINIDGNPDVFETLLYFAYTGTLTMFPNSALDLLAMVCYMQFTYAYSACETFIIKKCLNSRQIQLGDVFKIYLLAKNQINHFRQLANVAENIMVKKVQELKRSDVFLQNATVSFLENFLSRKDFNDEQQVLELAVNWLKLDWDTRCTYAHSLLTKVRLGLVKSKQLTELITEEILEIPNCKALIDEVLHLRTSTTSPTTRSLKAPHLYATRTTITAPVSMKRPVYDRFLGISRTCLQYYDYRQWKWISLRRMAPVSYGASNQTLIAVNGRLHIAGGLGQDQDSYSDQDDDYENGYDDESKPFCHDDFLRYDAVHNSWKQLPAMKVARHSFPMVDLDGYIYAIGGSDETGTEIADVERFDQGKQEWEILPPLPERCRSLSAVVFKGKIIVHGITSAEDSADTSNLLFKYVVQVYHPNSNYWQRAHSEVHDIGIRKYQRPRKLPHLFVYKDICYRVSCIEVPIYKVMVHVLEFHPCSNVPVDAVEVKVGESISQDHIPRGNSLGAFRVSGEVFVSVNGFSYNTGSSISSDQSMDVSLYPFDSFVAGHRGGGTATFTFDWKRLEQ